MSWLDWGISLGIGVAAGMLAWRLGLFTALRPADRYLQPYRAPQAAARREED